MSELFRPISAEQLTSWVFGELECRDSIFGIPRQQFYVPREDSALRCSVHGHPLQTPFGPAAGPHTQMAQNIVAAWLCGARYIELKTVQTLDELNVSKPCIDMEDEGYNVEWSQELKIYQSFDEYLRAWVLIHALHHHLGLPGDEPGIVFNLSVGYDLDGIRRPNMQWFLDQVEDCSEYKQSVVAQVAKYFPAVRDLDIPDRLSDNVTLSTMHGCPPHEIEAIVSYLLRERRLHTLVKCNPTLLGPERLRTILNNDLNYVDVVVPDAAFEHDLRYPDAVAMFGNLKRSAKQCGLEFGVKLSNTLEVENRRSVFDAAEKTSYLSGRPLHAITVNLAHALAEEFAGELPMSFSAGASAANVPALLAAGMRTITVCSELLKTGGYLRLLDCVESASAAFADVGATSAGDFILKSAGSDDPKIDLHAAALTNLRRYATRTRADPDFTKSRFDTSHAKTSRTLEQFDCIKAPCMDECPLHQQVPRYMDAVCRGDIAEARRIVTADNPLPCILGRICDHLCEQACVRTLIDAPVAIRDIKRFVMEGPREPEHAGTATPSGKKVAIVGSGPGGMSAAIELARAGFAVVIFEQHPYPGGMVGGVVPEYRLPRRVFERDFSTLVQLGVEVRCNQRVGRDVRLSQLRQDGFDNVIIMAGAQLSKTLPLAGSDCDDVVDALKFLRRSREDRALDLGKRIGVIGAGDTAMDCARVAKRQNSRHVTLIYRRTIDQMPADREEVEQLVDEGIEVLELVKPQGLVVEEGELRALKCRRMAYAGDHDASGRKIPHEIPNSDFELPLDTLILAISQHAVLDFFDREAIDVNERGYIKCDPVTFETSVPGVFAGGDVANNGPASIVKAAAAGKAIADTIIRRQRSEADAIEPLRCDRATLLRRRGQKKRRIDAPQRPVADRDNFEEVVLTYSERQAREEAGRCLDCDTFCSLCVGVCPNMALQTYETARFEVRLPHIHINGNEATVEAGEIYRVRQPFQVAVLTDFCNECGNCTTFCPTSGQPYRDKPRLFLAREDFEAQQDNAFMVFRDGDAWALNARFDGDDHRIELNGKLDYAGPAFRARIDPVGFEVESAEATGLDGNYSLGACATMYVLLSGLRRSLPFLPAASHCNSPITGRIGHPGYEV